MKTRLNLFLEKLTPDEFNKAFFYTYEENKNDKYNNDPFARKYDNFQSALESAFTWSNTKEEHEYWHNIYERDAMPKEVPNVATNDAFVTPGFAIDKMMAYNEIIGLAQGYLDVIVEYPERAQELAINALEVINNKYEKTKKYAKRNN